MKSRRSEPRAGRPGASRSTERSTPTGGPDRGKDERGKGRPARDARPGRDKGEGRAEARGDDRKQKPAEARKGARKPGEGRGRKPERGAPAQGPRDARAGGGSARRGEGAGSRDRARPPQQGQRQKPRPKARPVAPEAQGPQRSGTVALIGRPNVGKSTLLNAALEQPLAIVSPTPQTTRDALLGVVHHGNAEIALLDTPGLHRPRTQLGRVMNEAARDAARRADVVLFVTDLPQRTEPKKVEEKPRLRPLTPHPGDLSLLADLGTDAPVVLVVNKVDRVRDKAQMLPLLEALGKVRPFAAVVPISALREDGITRVLDEVAPLLPEGPFRYEKDEFTDRPTRFFAAEYVREQILRATKDEVPHAVAVTIDRFVEPSAQGRAVHIDATIHVERPGQKRILIGAAGEMMKRIGTAARQRIEELVGQQVVLKLWVRVTPDWRESVPRLEELGYSKQRGNKGAEAAGEYVILATLDAEGEQAEEDGDELDSDDEDEAEADDLDEDEDDDGAEGDEDLDDEEEQPDEDGEEQ